MQPLDLTAASRGLDQHFGNSKKEVKVAFLLLATPLNQGEVGETAVISNITDTQALLRIVAELMNAMRLREARPAGRA
jgi:hypothetical protein